MLRAYNFICDTLEINRHGPKLNIMENAASTALKQMLWKRRKLVQLPPPHIYRRNSAEHAIRTLKNYLLGVSRQYTTIF